MFCLCLGSIFYVTLNNLIVKIKLIDELRPVVVQGHMSVMVPRLVVGSITIRGNAIFIFISSLWYRGKARR